MKCPKCKERTEVLETNTRIDTPTRRRRRCLNPHCEKRFTSFETSLESNKPVVPGQLEAELRKIVGNRRGQDPEALAAALAVDRRKAKIAREQRQRERYQSDDEAPRRLTNHDGSLNRELGRYR